MLFARGYDRRTRIERGYEVWLGYSGRLDHYCTAVPPVVAVP
jgi:hypothetical protein